MPTFGTSTGNCSYDVIREGEGDTLKVNCEQCAYSPSIEDNFVCMAKTVEKLMEMPGTYKIIFSQKRDYEYDYHQTRLLIEISQVYNQLAKRKDFFGYHALSPDPTCTKCANTRHGELQSIMRMMKGDPLGAYVELKRTIRREKIKQETYPDPRCQPCIDNFVSILNQIASMLEKTKMIAIAQPYLAGYKVGDRSVYRRIFTPIIKPDFMFTKLMATYPTDGEELDSYIVGDNTEVTIFGFEDSVQTLYHVIPPEFKLSEEKYEILDLARNIMAEHKPKRSEFVDPGRMRDVFYNVGHDLIEELVDYRKVRMTQKEIDELTRILVRYTVGFGLIEVLLADEKMQDISVNSPLGQIPLYIVHGDYDDCITNIIPMKTEAESWASKLRMMSGRPLDEANQILDTEMELPNASARISVITEPLAPQGLAFSFRRHRDKPWTLPLFVKYKMVTPLAAGLLSFLIDGTRTMLICGTRSSGKSSFLSSLLVEIMRRFRIITVEDTLELPTASMRKLGFNIQPMKVASALAKGTSEMPADDGIRSTLRLGDSSLIVGEVRSTEAKALYEAMRVGAAANVVAGTIHGDSPYGIFDRLVNDIGVPKTSFKATDVVVIANPVKSAGSLQKQRRITQITEVRKDWDDDPQTEGAFVDLMKYNPVSDQIEPTNELLNGESDILKMIAANIKEFAGNWDAMWDNILLRAKCKETITNLALKMKDNDLLEAPFVIRSNDRYHRICQEVVNEVGSLDSKRIFFDWNEWLQREIKKRKASK